MMLEKTNEKSFSNNNKILVVDDNKSHLEFLEIWLRENGFKVITVNSGYEAIDKFNHESFDLVLTDICMPGINGHILAQYIRNVNKDIPVVAITASPFFDDSNFELVISKPYELEGLVNSLQSVLQKKSSISCALNVRNGKTLHQLQEFKHGHQTN